MLCPNAGAGFSVRHFELLAAIIPINDADTPESLQARAKNANLLPQFIALRREHRSDGERLLSRLRALQLRRRHSDGCLVCPADDHAADVLLLPVEAFGVAIDMVALDVFARRDVRRGLYAVDVQREIALTCLAGGRHFGGVHLRDVQARLSPQVADGGASAGGAAADSVPSLAALLYRATVHG